MPRYLYLVAGDYRITVEAGDGSTATRTNKSYRGEKAFTIRANEEVTEEVICRPINIGAGCRSTRRSPPASTNMPTPT